MPLGRNQESIVHFHHLILHALTQPRAPASPEEHCRSNSQLHPSKMDSDACSGSSPKWHVCSLSMRGHLIREAEAIEPRVLNKYMGGSKDDLLTSEDLETCWDPDAAYTPA